MRRNINNIEIVEPPIGELTKKYSAFSAIRRTCLAGCGCLVIVAIALVVAVKIAMGPGPQIFKTVPLSFPADIPIYDKDNIEKITFVPGRYKTVGFEIAAIFPKLILSPLITQDNNKSSTAVQLSGAQNLWNTIRAPISDNRDAIQIEWGSLDAEPTFINNYYKNELRKQNYNISDENESKTEQSFSFSKDKISGSLYVYGNEEEKPGADSMIFTVNVPSVK